MATIMVVEDNEGSRDALSRRLARRGYQVVLAVDGHQAVSIGRSAKSDLILMDLGLPTAIRRFRQAVMSSTPSRSGFSSCW